MTPRDAERLRLILMPFAVDGFAWAAFLFLVRCFGWALAPALAGVNKISDDLLLWREFRRVKPPEEMA